MYAKLLKLIDSFIGDLFPMEYLIINKDFVFFGDIEVQPNWVVKSDSDPRFEKLLFSLEEKIDAEQDMCLVKLPGAGKQIDEILVQNSYLLEPVTPYGGIGPLAPVILRCSRRICLPPPTSPKIQNTWVSREIKP